MQSAKRHVLSRPPRKAAAFLLCTVNSCISCTSGRVCARRARSHPNSPRSTSVTESQANEFHSHCDAGRRAPDSGLGANGGRGRLTGQMLIATLSSTDAAFVKAGQCARVPAGVALVDVSGAGQPGRPEGARSEVTVALLAPGRQGSVRYVLEIVTEPGELLSVPNEGSSRLVIHAWYAGLCRPWPSRARSSPVSRASCSPRSSKVSPPASRW